MGIRGAPVETSHGGRASVREALLASADRDTVAGYKWSWTRNPGLPEDSHKLAALAFAAGRRSERRRKQ